MRRTLSNCTVAVLQQQLCLKFMLISMAEQPVTGCAWWQPKLLLQAPVLHPLNSTDPGVCLARSALNRAHSKGVHGECMLLQIAQATVACISPDNFWKSLVSK